MNVLQIPEALFKEFSASLGVGDEWEQLTSEGIFTLKGIVEIDVLGKRSNKFKYALGFKNEDPPFIFVLLEDVIPGDDAAFSKTVFKITAQTEETNEWSIKIQFSACDLGLNTSSPDTVSLILERFVDLTSIAIAEIEERWEINYN